MLLRFSGEYSPNDIDDLVSENVAQSGVVVSVASFGASFRVDHSQNHSDVKVDLRLRMRSVEGKTQDFAAVFNRPHEGSLLGIAFIRPPRRNDSISVIGDPGHCEIQQFMLVRVIQISEDRKWMIGIVDGGVPIMGLNEFDRLSGGALLEPPNASSCVGIGGMVPNRKGQVCVIGSRQRRVFIDSDSPYQVVQNASQIMNEIGVDEGPPLDIGQWIDLDKGPIACVVLVGRSDEFIWLRTVPGVDFCVESIEQFFSAA